MRAERAQGQESEFTSARSLAAVTPGAATLPLWASVWSVGGDQCSLPIRWLREQQLGACAKGLAQSLAQRRHVVRGSIVHVSL